MPLRSRGRGTADVLEPCSCKSNLTWIGLLLLNWFISYRLLADLAFLAVTKGCPFSSLCCTIVSGRYCISFAFTCHVFDFQLDLLLLEFKGMMCARMKWSSSAFPLSSSACLSPHRSLQVVLPSSLPVEFPNVFPCLLPRSHVTLSCLPGVHAITAPSLVCLLDAWNYYFVNHFID
jgi:hypothetical protein